MDKDDDGLKEIKYYKVTATFRGGAKRTEIIEVHPWNVNVNSKEDMGEYLMERFGMNSGNINWTKTIPPKKFFEKKIEDTKELMKSLKTKLKYYEAFLKQIKPLKEKES